MSCQYDHLPMALMLVNEVKHPAAAELVQVK